MSVPPTSVKAALAFLGITPPGVKRGSAQTVIDATVARWKDGPLTSHFKDLRKAWHPDRFNDSNADAELSEAEAHERYMQLQPAYDLLLERLKVKAKPADIKRCAVCSSLRCPDDAAFCYSCGVAYRLATPRTECPCCDAERVATGARFCTNCGYDYQPPDALIDRLRAEGFTPSDIDGARAAGKLATWRKHPGSSTIKNDITLWKLRRDLKWA